MEAYGISEEPALEGAGDEEIGAAEEGEWSQQPVISEGQTGETSGSTPPEDTRSQTSSKRSRGSAKSQG